MVRRNPFDKRQPKRKKIKRITKSIPRTKRSKYRPITSLRRIKKIKTINDAPQIETTSEVTVSESIPEKEVLYNDVYKESVFLLESFADIQKQVERKNESAIERINNIGASGSENKKVTKICDLTNKEIIELIREKEKKVNELLSLVEIQEASKTNNNGSEVIMHTSSEDTQPQTPLQITDQREERLLIEDKSTKEHPATPPKIIHAPNIPEVIHQDQKKATDQITYYQNLEKKSGNKEKEENNKLVKERDAQIEKAVADKNMDVNVIEKGTHYPATKEVEIQESSTEEQEEGAENNKAENMETQEPFIEEKEEEKNKESYKNKITRLKKELEEAKKNNETDRANRIVGIIRIAKEEKKQKKLKEKENAKIAPEKPLLSREYAKGDIVDFPSNENTIREGGEIIRIDTNSNTGEQMATIIWVKDSKAKHSDVSLKKLDAVQKKSIKENLLRQYKDELKLTKQHKDTKKVHEIAKKIHDLKEDKVLPLDTARDNFFKEYKKYMGGRIEKEMIREIMQIHKSEEKWPPHLKKAKEEYTKARHGQFNTLKEGKSIPQDQLFEELYEEEDKNMKRMRQEFLSENQNNLVSKSLNLIKNNKTGIKTAGWVVAGLAGPAGLLRKALITGIGAFTTLELTKSKEKYIKKLKEKKLIEHEEFNELTLPEIEKRYKEREKQIKNTRKLFLAAQGAAALVTFYGISSLDMLDKFDSSLKDDVQITTKPKLNSSTNLKTPEVSTEAPAEQPTSHQKISSQSSGEVTITDTNKNSLVLKSLEQHSNDLKGYYIGPNGERLFQELENGNFIEIDTSTIQNNTLKTSIETGIKARFPSSEDSTILKDQASIPVPTPKPIPTDTSTKSIEVQADSTNTPESKVEPLSRVKHASEIAEKKAQVFKDALSNAHTDHEIILKKIFDFSDPNYLMKQNINTLQGWNENWGFGSQVIPEYIAEDYENGEISTLQEHIKRLEVDARDPFSETQKLQMSTGEYINKLLEAKVKLNA